MSDLAGEIEREFWERLGLDLGKKSPSSTGSGAQSSQSQDSISAGKKAAQGLIQEFTKNIQNPVTFEKFEWQELPTQKAERKLWEQLLGHEGGSQSMAEYRQFETGATRDLDATKLDFEAFLSPLVLGRFAEFMHQNRKQKDGSLRAGDNWQKGIPLDAYMKSGWRHFFEWWSDHRESKFRAELGYDTIDGNRLEESLCALLFNIQGYLHEILKAKYSLSEKEPPPYEPQSSSPLPRSPRPSPLR